MVGIIGAMEIEVSGYLKLMTKKTVADFRGGQIYTGKINGKDAAVIKCGIGKVNAAVAASALILRVNGLRFIINSGVAGGLKNGIKHGDFVVASAAVQHDYDQTFDGLKPGQIPGFNSGEFTCDKGLADKFCGVLSGLGYDYSRGVIASGDQFISGKQRRDTIRAVFDASACDMETAAIAQVCQMFSVPFLGVRAISDCADDSAVSDFYSFCVSSSEKSITAVCEFLKII
jgi:adenosylhomocysteine nucleosidase